MRTTDGIHDKAIGRKQNIPREIKKRITTRNNISKTMANLRFQAVASASKKKPLEVVAPIERPSEYYAKYVFTRAKMYKYLP